MRILRTTAPLVAALTLVACGGGGGSTEKLCKAVRSDHSIAAVFAGFDPTNPERALEQLRTARVTLGELRDAAPDEVRDDIDVEIAYVQALVDGIDGVEPGDAAHAVEVVRQVTADHPEVADAAAALSSWSEKNCSP
jgi:hypothetical protein